MFPESVKIVPKKVRTRKTQEMRQQEVVDAAIRAIGRKGLSHTTLTDIAKEAGIGYGNLSFRFRTKDSLLLAALRSVVDEYTAAIEAAAASDGSAAERLDRVIAASFERSLTSRNKLAVWAAFWSECHTRAAYRKLFGEFRQREIRRTTDLCRELANELDLRDAQPDSIATGINALVEGLWSSMARGGTIDREQGLQVARDFISAIFRL